MDITLVTSIMNEEIHGTDNDKKTGCGINLQKGDNINKFRRAGKMVDLKEITCERCKNAFAKKMIKADKKEMARLLKEERQREKSGLADEGIVPLGGTVAKITSVPTVNEPQIAEQSPNYEEPKAVAGTGVALDDSLAQFNITPPTQEPAPTVKNDDFMSQFAIQKPEVEKEEVKEKSPVNNFENDFLAQFAINVNKEEEIQKTENVTEEISEDEGSIDFSEINPPLSVYEEPDEELPETDDKPVGIIDEDDIMKMFAFGNVKASSSQSPAVDNSNYNYVTPVSEEPTPIPEPVNDISTKNEFSDNSDFGYVANKLFGTEEYQQELIQEEPDEMSDIEFSSLEEISSVEKKIIEPPVLEDIEIPSLEEISPIEESIPAVEDIEVPSLEEISPIEESIPAVEDMEVPSFEEISPMEESIPAVEDMEVPSFEEISPIEESIPAVEDMEVPSLEDMVLLMENDETTQEEPIEEIPESTVSEQPVMSQDYVQSAPVQSMPAYPEQTPVQPIPVQSVPVYPQQPIYPQQIPYPQQPMIGQVVNVPQFSGYDQNNQPIYTYAQMQLTGYSPNGQPIYIPFGQPAMQQPVMQQPFVQPVVPPVSQTPANVAVNKTEGQSLTPGQRIAAAAAAKGGMPATASNISKIAVNEHSRSTSQVFINAIAESKEYANKSLTETQGEQARNMPIINSIEDMLSAMGDNSEKEKRLKQESMKKNVPIYQEYTASSNSVRTAKPRTQMPVENKPLSKSELKEKKKQDKIDAKFKKDLAKRGF